LRDRRPRPDRVQQARTDQSTDAHGRRPVGMSVTATQLSVAFAAGAVSVVSPCVWPLIPGYLSFVSGVGAAELPEQRRLVAVAASGFVAGFTAVFTFAGAGSGVLGGQFLDHRRGLELVGGAIVIGMGVLMLLPTAALLQREWR